MPSPLIILGAGMTGLSAGIASGADVYEAADHPGGICSSYYLRPGSTERLSHAPSDGQAYRFEVGGGHWIFGGDPTVLSFIKTLAPVESYARKSSVFLPSEKRFADFPIQNHLRALGPERAARAIDEMVHPTGDASTMKDWLRRTFGPTLFDLFFDGFNRLYTAGLYDRIVPQDAYKSPIDLKLVQAGASGAAPAVGYNTRYLYPRDGLDALSQRMADKCHIHYGKRATRIDAGQRVVYFEDSSSQTYARLLSTLPLDVTLKLANLQTDAPADPYTSVLVLNIGAAKGPACPADHWVYVPQSRSGFHRVGFYSNVSTSFLPAGKPNHASIYVEKAYVGGRKPSPDELKSVCAAVVAELQGWNWIGQADVVDPTWIDSAYTWSWCGSAWRGAAMKILEQHDIYPVGRYARWLFQGIADSIRDGFIAGAALGKT